MGNVNLPSWQLSVPANIAGGLLGAMLHISAPGPHAGFQRAMVSSTKKYTSARASWRKERVGNPPPPPKRCRRNHRRIVCTGDITVAPATCGGSVES